MIDGLITWLESEYGINNYNWYGSEYFTMKGDKLEKIPTEGEYIEKTENNWFYCLYDKSLKSGYDYYRYENGWIWIMSQMLPAIYELKAH